MGRVDELMEEKGAEEEDGEGEDDEEGAKEGEEGEGEKKDEVPLRNLFPRTSVSIRVLMSYKRFSFSSLTVSIKRPFRR